MSAIESVIYEKGKSVTLTATNGTLTETAAGFSLTRAAGTSDMSVNILNGAGFGFGEKSYFRVKFRTPGRRNARILKFYLSSSIGSFGSPFDQYTLDTYYTSQNLGEDDDGFQTVLVPVPNRATSGLTGANKDKINTLRIVVDSYSTSYAGDIEFERISLVRPSLIVAYGMDDGYETDYSVVYQALVESGANIPFYSAIIGRTFGGQYNVTNGVITGDVNHLTLTRAMTDEMMASGLWTPVNHTWQHAKMGSAAIENGSLTETNALSSTTTDNRTPPEFAWDIANSYGGAIDPSITDAVRYELDTNAAFMRANGMSANNSEMHVVSPFGFWSGDTTRAARAGGYLSHRGAHGLKWVATTPNAGLSSVWDIKAHSNDNGGLIHSVKLGIASGGGMAMTYHHRQPVATTEAARIEELAKEFVELQRMQDAGLVTFVSYQEFVDLMESETVTTL